MTTVPIESLPFSLTEELCTTTYTCMVTELFQLDRTFKGHLVHVPCNEQGHLQLYQVAQSPVQPDLECLQRMGHPPSLWAASYSASLRYKINRNFFFFHLKTFPFVPSQQILLKCLLLYGQHSQQGSTTAGFILVAFLHTMVQRRHVHLDLRESTGICESSILSVLKL